MSLSLTFLPVVLIVCPIIGEWMLVANKEIYPNKLNMTFPLFTGYFTELDKELYLPFYIIISLVALAFFLFYNTLIRFCGWLCSLCY